MSDVLYSGEKGYVKFQNYRLDVTNWKLTVKTEKDDTTDTGCENWQRQLGTVKSASGTFDAFLRVDDLPVGSPGPNIQVGSIVAAKLYVGDPENDQAFELNALIDQYDFTSDVKKALSYSCSFSSSGVVLCPGETA